MPDNPAPMMMASKSRLAFWLGGEAVTLAPEAEFCPNYPVLRDVTNPIHARRGYRIA
jgi:hypothetical protein